MKKILFVMVALLSAITMSAKDDVTVEKGSLDEIKNAGNSKVFIVWDYSKATLEGKPVDAFLKEKGKDWVASYPQELAEAEAVFAKEVDKCKFVTVTTNKEEAQYIITVKMKNFHYGSTGLSVMVGFGAGDAHFDAKVEFTKNGGSEVFAVLNVDGVPGDGYGNERRRRKAYQELGEWVKKLIKRAGKSVNSNSYYE